jgi:hypothetical protein
VSVQASLGISLEEYLTRGQISELLVNRIERVSFVAVFYLCDFVRKEQRLVLVLILAISFFRLFIY